MLRDRTQNIIQNHRVYFAAYYAMQLNEDALAFVILSV